MIQLTLENYRQLVEGALTQVLRLAFLKRSTVADLAALAALVQFESTPSGYRLSMPMRNGTLSIDQSGAITEQP